MSQKWHYAKDGKRFGPITAQDLKELAASGELQPDDLVWTEGRDEWKPANMVKGLFPPSPEMPPPPVPSPVAKAPPPVPSAASDNSSFGDDDDAPALWNPKALRIWSLFISWGFGAFLLARNWKTLGDEDRAKKAMYWFYSYVAFIVLFFLTPESIFSFTACFWIQLGVLAVWVFLEAMPQITFVYERWNNTYQRKSWGPPAGIVVALVFGITVLGSLAEIGQDGGTITFAEEVDPVTFELTNEGTEFTTGVVNMVIRGNGSFGDSRLIVSSRKDDEEAWQIVDEHTVDPEWDIIAGPFLLSEAGSYEISVKTSSGILVANNFVTIVP